MIDVDATLAAIRTTLEAHNALPERTDCDHCSQAVPGRPPQIACVGCGGNVVPTEAVRMELASDGAWRVGIRQDPHSAGLRQNDENAWECKACREVRDAAESKARDEAQATEASKARAEAEAKE